MVYDPTLLSRALGSFPRYFFSTLVSFAPMPPLSGAFFLPQIVSALRPRFLHGASSGNQDPPTPDLQGALTSLLFSSYEAASSVLCLQVFSSGAAPRPPFFAPDALSFFFGFLPDDFLCVKPTFP